MSTHFAPGELQTIQKERDGRKLVVFGVLAFGAGVIGVVLAILLKVVWLGVLGGPIGGLSWIALIVGAACAIWGFLMVRDARESRGQR
ncbi:hypothetical protein GC169_11635 [bacterium]|nr:hypothetical protein [bacterium]